MSFFKQNPTLHLSREKKKTQIESYLLRFIDRKEWRAFLSDRPVKLDCKSLACRMERLIT